MAGIDDAYGDGWGTPPFNPLGNLPSYGALKTKEQAIAALNEARAALGIWEQRFVEAGGNKPKVKTDPVPASAFEYVGDESESTFAYNGQPLTKAQYKALSEGSSSAPSPELQNATDAKYLLENYIQTLTGGQSTLPPDPEIAARTAAEKDAKTAADKKANAKPVEIGLEQFMAAISGQESGGAYDAENKDSGAYGRFQIMPENWPSWSAEAGLGGQPPTPANQDRVAAFKMQQYYNKTGNWADVASIWYSGSPLSAYTDNERTRKQYTDGTEYPSIQEYVDSIMGKLGTYAKNTTQGTMTPSGIAITGGDGGTLKPYDPTMDFLKSGAYALEGERADEMDRRYSNASDRAKDYLAMIGAENNLVGDQAAMKKLSQDMNDNANETAAALNKMYKDGDLDYYDLQSPGIWSDPLAMLYKQLKTAPEGFSDSFLSQIPRQVPGEYYIDDELGLPAPSAERWWEGTVNRYAAGTPGISFHDEPYVAAYKAGKAVPAAVLARLQAAGVAGPAGQGSTWKPNTPAPTTPVDAPPQAAPVTGYRPGTVPYNSTVPSPERIYDTNDWLDAAVSTMARNVSAGNTGLPASWGVQGLDSWIGVPAAAMDASFLNYLRSIISTYRDTPEIQQAFGKDPGVATTYVPDPNAKPDPAATPKKATPGTGGGGGNGQGFSSGNQYSGVYGGSSAAQQGDPDLDKKLGWEREQYKWLKEYQQAQLDLAKIADTRSAEYQGAQIRWGDADLAYKNASQELEKVDQALRQKQYEEVLRQAQVEEAMSGIKLDMAKVKQDADLLYQSADLELKKQAGALSQAEYEERKRQFDTTFAYQKEKDDKALGLERAKTIAALGANPADVIQQQFFYGSQADPEGEAYDVFTGESRGRKTYGQLTEEDAPIYKAARGKVPLMSMGDDDFVNDFLSITGDQQANRATGNEELVFNPTGAPIAIINNRDARETGLVPPKGRPFGANVKAGR